MSTILRALQKQKLERSHTMPGFIEKDAGGLKWKVALLASFLIIISLLVVLIYLLVKPVNEVQQAEGFTAPVVSLHSSNEEKLPISDKAEDKLIRKISFDLRPLPQRQEPVEFDEESAVVEEVPPINNQQSEVAVKEPVLVVVTGEKPQALADNLNNEIDYGDTSADLQQRFENALLMSGSEDKEPVERVTEGDGSDIHQLSSEFQAKVPAISYDSHIYSSVAKERLIRINGEDLKEGQFDSSGKIEVVAIQENRTIFRLGRQSFSLESLSDWSGF